MKPSQSSRSDLGPDSTTALRASLWSVAFLALAASARAQLGPGHAPPSSAAEVQTLTPWDAQIGDRVGFSVALEEQHLLVGVPYDNLSGTRSGSVASFVKRGSRWEQRDILAPPGGRKGDYFGMALDLDGTECAVGSPWNSELAPRSGAVHLFRWRDGHWLHSAELHQPTPSRDAQLGEAIALSGGLLVVGARNELHGGESTGAAFVWERHEGNWELRGSLRGSRSESGAMFGFRVAAAGGRVFVSAHGERDGRGAVYVFERGLGGWEEVERLEGPDPASGDYFGLALAAGPGGLLIGAPWRDTQDENGGEAYYYEPELGTWRLRERLVQAGASAFGSVVALNSRSLVIGARGTSVRGGASGAFAFHAPRSGAGLGVLEPLRLPTPMGELCRSLAIDGDELVLGSEGPEERPASPGRVTVLPLLGP
jgi:hypothetical protein